MTSLEKDVGSHQAFGSFCEHSGTGGCVTLISKKLVRRASSTTSVEVLAGRCLVVSLQLQDMMFQVANIHIEPAATIEDKKLLLLKLKGNLVDASVGMALLGGDFNFIPTGEAKISFQEVEAWIPRDPLAHFFDETMSNMTELIQDSYTRLHIEKGILKSGSRIDRWYCNLPEVDLMDCQPRATTMHNLFNKSKLSDHAAVSVVLHPPSRRAPMANFIPNWVVNHEQFVGFVQEVVADSPIDSCPFMRLQILKEAIYCSSDLVKQFVQDNDIPKSTEEELYWAVLLWRGDRAGLAHLVHKATKADPQLKEVVDTSSHKVTDLKWLQEHIRQLQQELHKQWMNDAAAMPTEANSTAATAKTKAMQRLMARKRLWDSTGKAISLQGIRGSQG